MGRIASISIRAVRLIMQELGLGSRIIAVVAIHVTTFVRMKVQQNRNCDIAAGVYLG